MCQALRGAIRYSFLNVALSFINGKIKLREHLQNLPNNNQVPMQNNANIHNIVYENYMSDT